MNLRQLFNIYRKDNSIKQFGALLTEGYSQKCHLLGAVGSQLSMVVGAIHCSTPHNGLIICKDREEALYFIHDLEELLPEYHVALYPSSCKRPYQIEAIDNANVLQRTEVLNLINESQPGELIIVTYFEALFEKVISRKSLVANTLNLVVGEKPGMNLVFEILESYSYELVDFVSKPGDFAVRGGIIDVYSYSFEQPYRVEFNGDEVESIRIFDVDSQLSLKQTSQIKIIPNLNYATFIEERISFFEYISPSTLIYTDDLHELKEEINDQFKKAVEIYESTQASTSGTSLRSKPEELFLFSDALISQINQLNVVEFSKTPFYEGSKATLKFNSAGQPFFKKQFNLLLDHLAQNQSLGITNYISCENEKQLNRLKEIFEQENPAVTFNGIISSIHAGFCDKDRNFALYTDHQIFERYHRYKVKKPAKSNISLKELIGLQPGDFVAHVNHGIGRFAGLEKIKSGNIEQEAVKIVFSDDDAIFVPINSLYKISKYVSKDGTAPKLNKLGSQEWNKTKSKVKKRIKELAFDLVALYAKRRAQKGFAFSPDNYLLHELEASFIYEETPDQSKVIEEVKADMEKPYPMDRLVCGDVGFGKTEVAIRAAFKAATDGKQVAVLVPTTILAMQHYNTFKERMKGFPIEIDYINRFKSSKEQKETLKKLKEGKIDIIIGTHRLLSKDVLFKDLGLFIVDEEHKFGVGDKEKLRLVKVNVDTLTLTATPIPRTLQFSLLGIRDMSVINTPPANRLPVETIVKSFNQELIRDSIAYELRRGGQVLFIHNRIKDLEEIAGLIKKLVPEARITFAHGQQNGDLMEETILRFINKEYDILVCTTIVESGLDIPNANTIIINQAHTYGLSDLHQMRGRVGRSNRKAYCYLFVPSLLTLPTDSQKRLRAIEEFSDIGSGIQIALRDLDIRGAGDILGKEQSGFIADIGYELYQKILEECITELKIEQGLMEEVGEKACFLQSLDCQIDIDQEALIPDTYIKNVAERLSYYKRISEATEEEELKNIGKELIDRFGVMPHQVIALLDTIRVREYARTIGFEKVVIKEGKMRLNFITDHKSAYYNSSTFQQVISYIQKNPALATLKQNKETLQLIFNEVENIKRACLILRKLHETTQLVSQS